MRCVSFFFCSICFSLHKMVKKYHVVALLLLGTASGDRNSCDLSRGQLGKIEQEDLNTYITSEQVIPYSEMYPEEITKEVCKAVLHTHEYSLWCCS